MAYIKRLVISRLFIALVVFLSYLINAYFNTASAAPTYVINSVVYASESVACMAFNPSLGGATWVFERSDFQNNFTGGTGFTAVVHQCYYKANPGNASYPTGTISFINSSFDIRIYTCSNGGAFNPANNTCGAPPCTANQTTTYLSYGKVDTACINNCEAIFSGYTARNVICTITTPIAGYSYCDYNKYTTTGNVCASPAPPPPPVGAVEVTAGTTAYDCIKEGKSFGTVNSLTICLDKGEVGSEKILEPPNNSTTTNTDGSTTTTKTETVTNPDGTVTTKTTTTNTPVGGSSTTTVKTETQDKLGFCEENPTLSICKEEDESSWNGSCSTSFSCDGDAIQCAISKRIHLDNCELEQSVTDAQTEIESTSAYTDGEVLINGQYTADVQGFLDGTDPDSNRTVDLDNILSETGSASFSGDGMQDVSFSAMGQTMVLPLSDYNEYLVLMGYVLVALSYLAAYRIVMGAI